MPSRGLHEEFDRYLASRGVLMDTTGYGSVHSFMDRGVTMYGGRHREFDPFHAESGLRSWINGKRNVVGQDRATDWLRSGLGHICLDEIDSRLLKSYNWNSVFDSAYRSMVSRGWNTARFRSF